MIALCGYEEFKISWLYSRYMYSNSGALLLVENLTQDCYNNEFLYIADNSTIPLISAIRSYTYTNYYDIPEIASKIYTPKPEQVLYFDKRCTIPRIKCASIWKRTTKLSKADVIVVPSTTSIYKRNNCNVFLNPGHKTIYLIQANDIGYLAKTGQTFFEWHELNKHRVSSKNLNNQKNIDAIKSIGSSVCIYSGDLYYTNIRNSYIFDIIDGNYTKIIPENKLIKLVDNKDDKFTKESIQSIIDLLSSSDKESVHQGMRILANLDYTHFPAVTSYILESSYRNWQKFKPFNSTVQFMLKSINWGLSSLYLNITNEEIELIKDFIKKDAIDSITSNIKYKYCLQDKIDVKCNVDITIKNNEVLCNS